MKYGYVCHIRVPPEDAATAIDLVEKAGLYMQGMSLAQVVRLAMSGMFAHARDNGLVPEYNPFTISAKVAPFINAPRARKAQISETIGQSEYARAASDAPTFGEQVAASVSMQAKMERTPGARESRDAAKKRLRFQELHFKHKQDAMNMSREEKEELWDLGQELGEHV